MDLNQAAAPRIADLDCPRQTQSVRFEPLQDGSALYLQGSDRVQVLNLTASCVWLCCDGIKSVRELIDEMAGLLGQRSPSSAELERDVQKAISDLLEAGHLELSSDFSRTRPAEPSWTEPPDLQGASTAGREQA